MEPIIHNFNILSDYEVGRAIAAIEAVGRGTKPVAEVGDRTVGDIELLETDLRTCLEVAKEPHVKGFLLQHDSQRCSFGFYCEDWVLETLQFLYHEGQLLSAFHRDWILGLLFGYTPKAVSWFLSTSASVGQGATSQLCDGAGKVE